MRGAGTSSGSARFAHSSLRCRVAAPLMDGVALTNTLPVSVYRRAATPGLPLAAVSALSTGPHRSCTASRMLSGRSSQLGRVIAGLPFGVGSSVYPE